MCMACRPPNYPATTLALHASAHFRTLTSAFCLPLRLHFPCLFLTVTEVVSEGTAVYVGWANRRPTEIPTLFITSLVRVTRNHMWRVCFTNYKLCRSQWPRVRRRRSAAARLLRSWVRIPRGHGFLSVVSVVCCQVEVSATSWSLVQRSPTDCGASLCVI